MRELRRVQTVFTIDDNEHNRKLKDIRAQYQLTSEQIKTTGKYMDTGGDKIAAYTNKYDLLEAQLKTTKEWHEKYQERVDKVTARIKDHERVLAENAAAQDDLKNKIKSLTEVHGENSDEVKDAKDQLEKLKQEERDYKEQLTKSEQEIRKTNTQLEKTTQNQMQLKHEMEKTSVELKKQQSFFYQSGLKAEEYGEKMVKAGKKMDKIGGSLTRNVSLPLIAVGGFAANAALDFETAFVGVTKTIDEADVPGGYDAIKKSIREMTEVLPASHEEIAKVVEVAGQLGIEGESIMSFSKVMIDLGETTDITAENAAVSLARFANVTGMAQTDFDRLGASIVDLGNNYAATESEIVNMSTRLAAAGTAAGLSEPDILGLATGLTSLGLEAEAGGSAFSKLIKRMTVGVKTGNDDLTNFSKIAGVSTTEFKRAFEEDAANALTMFLGGLSKIEEDGGSAIVALDEIGITELRMSDATLRASGGFDVLSDALKTGSQAWEDNSALVEEAEKRYESSESQMQISQNRIKDVGIELGNKLLPHIVTFVEKIADLIENFQQLDPKTQDFLIKLGGMAAVTGPAVKAIGGVSTGVGKLMEAYGKIAKKSTGLDDAFGKTTSILSKGLVPQIGIAMGAIALLAGAHWLLDAPNRAYEQNLKDITNGIGDFSKEVDNAIPIVKDFNEEGTVFDKAIKEKRDAIARLEPNITEIYRKNIEARRALTTKEADDIDHYTELIDGLNDETVNKYNMRFDIAYDALHRETSVNKEQAAMNLKTVQDYDKARTELTADTYEKKLLVVQNGIQLEKELMEAGRVTEADIQKKYNEEYLKEAERQRNREIIDANETALSYIELNTKRYIEGNKIHVDALQGLSEIRDNEVKIENEYTAEVARIKEKYKYNDRLQNSHLEKAGRDRLKALQDNRNKENWIWTDRNKEFAGTMMEMVNLTVLHGGEVDKEMSDMVNGVISSMARSKDGSENFKEMMELSIQGIVDKQPELAGEAEKIKENLDEIFEGIKEGKYENGEDIINALTDGITTTDSKARVAEYLDGYVQIQEQKLSELAPKMEKPLEEAKMTMDDFAASIGEDAKTVGEELEKASAQVQMTSEELMYAITAWGEGSISEFTEMHLGRIEDYEKTLNDYVSITTNGLSKMEKSSSVSLKEFKKNMEHNQKATEEWVTNTKKLMEAGVSEGIIQELAKLGPAGAGVAKDWVKELEGMNGGSLTEFEKLNKGTKTFLEDFDKTYTDGLFLANESAKFQHEVNDYGGQGAYMIGQFIAGMIKELPYMIEMAEKMGYDTGIYTKQGLDGALPAARHSGYRYREEIVNELKPMPGQAKAQATKTGQGVADGINSKKSTVKRAANDLRNGVIGPFDGIDGIGSARGKYFDQGVARGINDNAYLASRAASKLAGRVKRSFDQTLEINSPSKVMARSAKWIPKTVAMEIDFGADDVEKSMQRLAEIPAKAEFVTNPKLSAETIIRNDQSGITQLARSMNDDRLILNRLLTTVEAIERKNPNLLLDGDKLVGGVIDRIDEQSGFISRENQLAYGG